ncbi:MAG: NUDIX hydrolase [Gammaproteobacteria bacterium]|nr:NUDIX hydrolase [Gammaproteobacteria bacterium]
MPSLQTPKLAADAIIELIDHPDRPIVLIERKNPPHGWAIPGGFVDIGESVPDAAVREAREETSMEVSLQCLLGCYSDPSRDPRGHTVSMIYIAQAHGEPVAADDAVNVGIFDPGAVNVPLAFDHAKILQDYVRYRRTGSVPPITR